MFGGGGDFLLCFGELGSLSCCLLFELSRGELIWSHEVEGDVLEGKLNSEISTLYGHPPIISAL